MSDVELEELEPLEEAPQGGHATGGVMPVQVNGGLPAPAYNPSADKEYYRFLFAGLIILVGCLMPFGPGAVPGYKSIRGAVFLVIGLGIIWSAWASIHHRRMVKGLLRWVFLAMIPFAVGIVDLLVAFNEGTAVYKWNQAVGAGNGVAGWGEFFGGLTQVLHPGDRVGEFLRHFGPGRLMTFVGGALAEVFMILAVMGGAKKIKEQKAERRASAGSRRRS